MTVRGHPWHSAAVIPFLLFALPVDVCGQPPSSLPGAEPRPRGPRRPAQTQRPERDRQPAGTAYGKGTKHLEVDCAKVVGRVRSLLGTNRGPLSFPRRPGERPVSHVESFRTLGIDFIRTHDFYGPTDWYVIFPDWSADPDDPAGYDFRSSDKRIRAIVDNGFNCFYRLGTSWKGRRIEPINDPPGTIRDADGRVVHRADRDDARKWAKICVQTMRHYTEGWNNASTLACMLDAGVDYAFQYCGDRHPGLGLHGLRDGKPKICAYSFLAWKRLMGAPDRVAATGSDQQGYNIVAGRDADGRHVRILISDFQSGHNSFRLEITNLPWDDATPFTVKRSLLDAKHRRLDIIEQSDGKGRALILERPFASGSVCLLEISSQ